MRIDRRIGSTSQLYDATASALRVPTSFRVRATDQDTRVGFNEYIVFNIQQFEQRIAYLAEQSIVGTPSHITVRGIGYVKVVVPPGWYLNGTIDGSAYLSSRTEATVFLERPGYYGIRVNHNTAHKRVADGTNVTLTTSYVDLIDNQDKNTYCYPGEWCMFHAYSEFQSLTTAVRITRMRIYNITTSTVVRNVTQYVDRAEIYTTAWFHSGNSGGSNSYPIGKTEYSIYIDANAASTVNTIARHLIFIQGYNEV